MKLALTVLTMVIASTVVAKDRGAEQVTILRSALSEIHQTAKSLESAKSTVISQRASISKLDKEINEEREARITAENDISRLKIVIEQMTAKQEKLESKVLQTGRERDVFILAFTIMGVITLYGAIRPFIALIPPPYSYAVYIAAPIALFFGLFFAARLILQFLVKLVF